MIKYLIPYVKNHKYILLILGLSQVLFAHADTDERLDHFLSISLEELISLETSIATATKQTISQSPAVVTLITSDDIKATGAVNLVDVLEGVPGIHVRMSQFGYRPLVHFRGASATQTLLMVNGTSMKDLMWGFGIFWKGLPASMIERVEIIRGPGSALFGADASAGVINVITKTAGKIDDTITGVRLGSFNTQSAWLQHGSTWNGYDIAITADFYKTDGHDPFISSDGQTQQDINFATNVSLAPGEARYGWRSEDIRFSVAKGNWRVLADYLHHSDLEIGLTGAGVLDPVTQASDSRYNIDLLYNNATISHNWSLDAELSYQHLEYSSGSGFQERPPGYTDATGLYPNGVINLMRSAERRAVFEVSGLYKGINDHAIRIGAGYNWQDLYFVEQFINSGTGPTGLPLPPGGPLVDVSDTPYAFAPEKTRKISHTFIQDIWHINKSWELTAGARYDDYSDFGDTFNPRLALVWQSTDKLTTKLMYGQAFRAPSYQELFAETSRTLPNDQLKPESSETVDLSFTYSTSKQLQLSMTLFHFKQMDIIRAITVGGLPKPQFQNTGDHNIQGVELEAQWQVAKTLRISGNYTHRNQDNSSFRIVQEGDQEAFLRADWNFQPKWNWNIQSNWIDERPRPVTDSRPALNEYSVTDTTMRYAGKQNWEFSASIRNLFDKDAREYTGSAIADDLPLPERNAYFEMRYKF